MITLARPDTHPEGRWIVGPTRPRRPGTDVRLLCFPSAGGTAGLYADWRPLLPAALALWPVELPGHGVRGAQEPSTDLQALARQVVDALAAEFASGEPYALFGHSLGGLLAFEVARRIDLAGLPAPRAVVVSAVRAPHHHRALPVALADDELLQWLLASGGLPAELLRHNGFVRRLLRVLRADLEMADSYSTPVAAPLRCPLHVLGGLDDRVATPDELAAWLDWEDPDGDEPLSMTFFPGGHGYLFEDPGPVLAHLAALLTAEPGAATPDLS